MYLWCMEKLTSLNKVQLAKMYTDKHFIPSEHHDYNTLLAALHFNKRIKHLTKGDIEFVRKHKTL